MEREVRADQLADQPSETGSLPTIGEQLLEEAKTRGFQNPRVAPGETWASLAAGGKKTFIVYEEGGVEKHFVATINQQE